jgi:hypothetical protein
VEWGDGGSSSAGREIYVLVRSRWPGWLARRRRERMATLFWNVPTLFQLHVATLTGCTLTKKKRICLPYGVFPLVVLQAMSNRRFGLTELVEYWLQGYVTITYQLFCLYITDVFSKISSSVKTTVLFVTPCVDRDSSVGIAALYRLDGPGI